MLSKKQKKKMLAQQKEDAKERVEYLDRDLIIFYFLENNMKEKLPEQEVLVETLKKANLGQEEYVDFLQFYLSYLTNFVLILKEIEKKLFGKKLIFDTELKKIDDHTYSTTEKSLSRIKKDIDYYSNLVKKLNVFIEAKYPHKINKIDNYRSFPKVSASFNNTSFIPNIIDKSRMESNIKNKEEKFVSDDVLLIQKKTEEEQEKEQEEQTKESTVCVNEAEKDSKVLKQEMSFFSNEDTITENKKEKKTEEKNIHFLEKEQSNQSNDLLDMINKLKQSS